MSVVRHLAHILAGHAARHLPATRAAWSDPMRAEVDAIENDLAALYWAAGCLFAAYGERTTLMKTVSLAPLAGTIGIFVFVIGSYILSGGPMRVLAEALPTLFITIAFGALAATSILSSNGGPGVFASLGQAFRGRRFYAPDYAALADTLTDVLAGKQAITRTDAATAMIADAKLLTDHGSTDAHQVGALLQARVDTIVAAQQRAVAVLDLFARNLLWFSAIAFVLAGTKTMTAVGSQPNAVLGGMLAHALVAPLLGGFLGAGIVFPLASRLTAGIRDDANIYTVIRTAVLARLGGLDAAAAVRTACDGLPADLMPAT